MVQKLKIFEDSPTTEDKLGFEGYADILMDLIESYEEKSSITIGIHGGWGSGKTSLMKILEKRFKNDDSYKTIWFNAWVYSKDEPIGLSLLQDIIIDFDREGKTLEKIRNEGVKSTLKQDFEEEINKFPNYRKLIVFIDDLDRCIPEKTIEVLETIKLFLDVEKCVFIIGVGRDVIERGIEARYKKNKMKISINKNDYIEKMIQVPFDLPNIEKEDFERFIEDLGIGEREESYIKIAIKETAYNPRKAKIFLNTLRLRQAILEKKGGAIDPDICAKLFVFEHGFSDFYRDVYKYKDQSLLVRLEKLVKEDPDEELKTELEKSELLKRYYLNEDLKSLLRDEPYFFGIDINPYFYLSEVKAPGEIQAFDGDESILNELLSGDFIKIGYAASKIKKMSELEKGGFFDIITPKLKDDDDKVRFSAVQALGGIGDERSFRILIELLEDKEQDIIMRGYAASALGNLGDEGAVDALMNALEDRDIAVRRKAAQAILCISNEEAVDALIKSLKDKNENVRRYAAEALGNIGSAKAVDALVESLKDKSISARKKAAWSLGRIGDERGVEPLIRSLKDKNEHVRENAAEALGNIGTEKAIDALIDSLKDKDAIVRWISAKALGSIGKEKAIKPLEGILKDESEYVRKNASEALKKIKEEKT